MNEHFVAIDAKNRTVLQELLLKLWEGDDLEEKKTVMFVMHNIDEAILLSNRIILMSSNLRKVKQEFKVPFERQRNRTELVQTKEYSRFRNQLMNVFYDDVLLKIGGSEVIL